MQAFPSVYNLFSIYAIVRGRVCKCTKATAFSVLSKHSLRETSNCVKTSTDTPVIFWGCGPSTQLYRYHHKHRATVKKPSILGLLGLDCQTMSHPSAEETSAFLGQFMSGGPPQSPHQSGEKLSATLCCFRFRPCFPASEKDFLLMGHCSWHATTGYTWNVYSRPLTIFRGNGAW